MRAVAAIDLGATSGRVILGAVGNDQLHLRHAEAVRLHEWEWA
ncbi:MAG TPA: hypothetical protein VIL55_01165 [Naasia sp.]|jgi:rhamnulokinase